MPASGAHFYIRADRRVRNTFEVLDYPRRTRAPRPGNQSSGKRYKEKKIKINEKKIIKKEKNTERVRIGLRAQNVTWRLSHRLLRTVLWSKCSLWIFVIYRICSKRKIKSYQNVMKEIDELSILQFFPHYNYNEFWNKRIRILSF